MPLVVTGPGVPRGVTLDEIAANIDLRPTLEGLGRVTTSNAVEGQSLVPFIQGRQVADWRTAAFVEHHGPVLNDADPDHPTIGDNPPSYVAVRTYNGTYAEYANGEIEYYDIRADPDELHNLASTLSDAQKASLHAAVVAARECHDGPTCWAAQRPSP